MSGLLCTRNDPSESSRSPKRDSPVRVFSGITTRFSPAWSSTPRSWDSSNGDSRHGRNARESRPTVLERFGTHLVRVSGLSAKRVVHCRRISLAPLTRIASQNATSPSSTTTNVVLKSAPRHLERDLRPAHRHSGSRSVLRGRWPTLRPRVLILATTCRIGDTSTPATSPAHTYLKNEVFLAYLIAAQQPHCGGVQYLVARNGLAVQTS